MPGAVEIEITETVDEVQHTKSNLPSTDENLALEWEIMPLPGYLVKSDIYLNLQLKVEKIVSGEPKPKNIDPGDKLCLANYPLMTMFATATVEFNQKPVMPSNTLISYTSQIRALQEYDKDGRAGILARSLWFQDKAGSHQTFAKQSKEHKDPYDQRHTPIVGGKIVDLYGPLMLDIFRQPQPFPDDVEIRIQLKRNKATFVLNGDEPPAGTRYQISIEKADLCLCRLKMNPGVDVYSMAGISGKIKYPFVQYDTKNFVQAKGVNTISTEILQDVLPNRIFFVLLDQEGYQGKYSINPFKFDDFLPESIYLRKNQNISLPTDPFTAKVHTLPAIPATPKLTGKALLQDTLDKATKALNDATAKKTAAQSALDAANAAGGGGGNRMRDEERDMARRKKKHYQRMAMEKYAYKKHREDSLPPQVYFSDEDQDPDLPRRRRRRDVEPAKPEEGAPEKKSMSNFSRLYVESIKVLNKEGSMNQIDIGLTYEDMAGGFFILPFDLRGDRIGASGKIVLQPFGILRLEIVFYEPLPKPIIVMAIMESQKVLTIPSGRSSEVTVE